MEIPKKKTAQEKEWDVLLKGEERFLKNHSKKVKSLVNQKLEQVVPKKLQETLDQAFYKAFEIVFDKGTPVIEKTYSKEKHQNNYKVNEYTAHIKQNRKSMKAFSKQAGAASTRNMLVSGVEGIGLGVLGIGIPDIPIFVGMILKSIYEIALTYGYAYDSLAERHFILKMIQVSLEHGGELTAGNEELNSILINELVLNNDIKSQMKITAATLSGELLYMKFLQGIPIAGIIGGLSDAVYLKRITDYAVLKYKRRFLSQIK